MTPTGESDDVEVLLAEGFRRDWARLLPIGRNPTTGGYERHLFNPAELACREWFSTAAAELGLDVVADRNGNLFGWWGNPDADGPGLVLGSHLDSVPDGGAFDGPLGVVSALAVVRALKAGRALPPRPMAVAAFAEEEGSRFGVACAGSRLLTGALDPDRARGLSDHDGTTWAQAAEKAGIAVRHLGPDPEALARIGTFIELHIEQGRALADGGSPASRGKSPDDGTPAAASGPIPEAGTGGSPVGVAAGIWPHGRWKLTFTGRADHAGTARMEDRQDPMLSYAMTVLAANKQARLSGARATFGRVQVTPNSINGIASQVVGWLDARAESEQALAAMLEVISKQATDRTDRDGTTLQIDRQSLSAQVCFDPRLAEELAVAAGEDRPVPVLPTQAGHDAGILAESGIPAGMVFVRNPTGISHSPQEFASEADCLAGVHALHRVALRLLEER